MTDAAAVAPAGAASSDRRDLGARRDVRSCFTLGLSLVAAILSGLAPALHASRADVVGALKADAQGGPRAHLRLRNAFVVSQVALSIVLVVGAGLFVARAAARHGRSIPASIRTASSWRRSICRSAATPPTPGRVFARELIQRVRATSRRAGGSARRRMMPLGDRGIGLGWAGGAWRRAAEPAAAPSMPTGTSIEPRYFTTHEDGALDAGAISPTPIASGTPSVVIVNETAARAWWPHQDAIGKVLVQQTGRPDAPTPCER